MYNRYIRNDRGVYTRIPESDEPHPAAAAAPPPGSSSPKAESQETHWIPPERFSPQMPPDSGDHLSRTIRRLLDRFHLENVDTGDLLLLLLLFILFKEDADEELLFALGLLLIL